MSADQKCANKYLMGDSVLKKNVYIYAFLHTTLDLFSLICNSSHYTLGYRYVLRQNLITYLHYLSGHCDIGIVRQE